MCLELLYLFCGLVAIYADISLEESLDAALCCADAVWVGTNKRWVFLADRTHAWRILCAKQEEDKSHSYIATVCRLLEVVSAGVIVHLGCDFVNTG